MYKNYSIEECDAALQRILQEHPGAAFYQKWTCGKCKKRVTGNTPNKLFIAGHCEDCGHITDIRKTGCNYQVHVAVGGLASVPPEGTS